MGHYLLLLFAICQPEMNIGQEGEKLIFDYSTSYSTNMISRERLNVLILTARGPTSYLLSLSLYMGRYRLQSQALIPRFLHRFR